MRVEPPVDPGNGQDASVEAAEACDKFSAKHEAYGGAVQVIDDEVEHLKWWRGQPPQVGLALSGGGIRSATYCLGVLQALAHKRVLPQVDYLSTVSGGGYIGSSLTYLLHQSACGTGDLPAFNVSDQNFPYVSYPMVSVGGDGPAGQSGAQTARNAPDPPGQASAPEVGGLSPQRDAVKRERLKGRLLRRLRQSSNYLVPGDGITVLSLAGVIVRNLAAGLAVHVALLVVLFQLLFWPTWSALDAPATAANPPKKGDVASVWSGVARLGSAASMPAPTAAAQATAPPATASAASAAPSQPFFVPAANGFLRAAGHLLGAFALLSGLYLLATRCFDAMEQDAAGKPSAGKGSRRFSPYRVRHLLDKSTHWLLLGALALLVVGGIPWTHEALVENAWLSQLAKLLAAGGPASPSGSGAGIVAVLIGVAGNVWGFLQAQSSKKPLIPTGLVVGLASAALFFGLLLLVYILTGWLHLHWDDHELLRIAAAAGLVLLLFGWLPNANYASLHRFYRDRLLELFLPDLQRLNQNLLDDARYLPLHLFLWRAFKRLWPHIKAWPRGAPGCRARPGQAVYARIGRSGPGNATMLGDVCGVQRRPEKPAREAAVARQDAGQMTSEARQAMKARGPYHLINANLVLVASQDPRFRPRGADNFILSPLYCGSRATGWIPTNPSPKVGPTLATAMAISGAAVNPNAGPGGHGITRQPVLSVLMGLLNLRLGYWFRNPGPPPQTPAAKPDDSTDTRRKAGPAHASKRPDWVKPNALYPGLLESFGRFNLNEFARYLLLTDGGHFENLGLYELVRRRLKLIIVCDATADPSFKFTDLSNAIQKVRADFGAIIDVSAEQLACLVPPPDAAAAHAGAAKAGQKSADAMARAAGPAAAARGHLIVPIRYSKRLWPDTDRNVPSTGSPDDPDDLNETGTLILLKATACQGMPADLFSYRRDHPEFPNQGTLDQFFDERQFDAYRELGFHTAYQMLAALPAERYGQVAAVETKHGYRSQTDHEVARLLFGWGEPQAAAHAGPESDPV